MIKADETKFYHVFTAGKFPTWDWNTNDWTTFEITKEWIKKVADCYDRTVHKGPLWIGHPWYSGAPAEGWIADVKCEGDKLYNSFEYLDEEFIKAVQAKKYLYVSCEFGRVMNVDHDYQLALGATNMPRVSGQKPLDFDGQKYSMKGCKSVYSPISAIFTSDLLKDFALSNKKYFFNQNTKQMDPFIKRIAALFGIDTEIYTTPEAIADQCSQKFSQISKKATELETENKKLSQERIESVLEFGKSTGRFKPAETETYENLLKGNFEAGKKLIYGLKVDPAFSNDQAPAGDTKVIDPAPDADKKFLNEDGSKMTYSQFLEKVRKDPSLSKKFSNEDFEKMPGFLELYDKTGTR